MYDCSQSCTTNVKKKKKNIVWAFIFYFIVFFIDWSSFKVVFYVTLSVCLLLSSATFQSSCSSDFDWSQLNTSVFVANVHLCLVSVFCRMNEFSSTFVRRTDASDSGDCRSCGCKTKLNHRPSSTVLDSWYEVFVSGFCQMWWRALRLFGPVSSH